MITLCWAIFGIPLFISLIIFLFLYKQPHIAKVLSTLAITLAFILSVFVFYGYLHGNLLTHGAIQSSVQWMIVGTVPIEFGILINNLSVLMLMIVTGIGALVFLFSQPYMEHEEGQSRYFASLSLFTFSMLGIVLANNLIQIFIFWELVGLSSYLLIGFWFEKESASTAGKKAFMTTRVGDVGMMIGILLLFGWLFRHGAGTFNFLDIEAVFSGDALKNTLQLLPQNGMTVIALLLFMGVMGKSAQVPLHVWLPDAMEGPTPVSALIHAATMVAAGIYLLARMSFLFEISHLAANIIAWTGALTALLAATIAIVQNDIKKVLAYSTLSQLGYMVLALGLASPGAGMFHLTTHAFFKALLFLCAGSFIHSMHTQDIWEMTNRNLLKRMPITSWSFLIGTIALMGIPPLSGFFSKEAILGAAFIGPKPLFWIAIFVVFLTAFYMGRVCTIIFINQNSPHKPEHLPHEGDWKICVPLLILAVLSVVGGFFPIQAFVSGHHAAHHGNEGTFLAVLSLGLAALGIGLSFLLYRNASEGNPRIPAKFMRNILLKKYYFDEFYDALIKYVQENIALISDVFEQKVIIEFMANGTAKNTRLLGNKLRKLQTGVVQFYALIFIVGISATLYFYILRGAY